MTALDEVEKKSPGTIIRGFTSTPEFVKMGVTQYQTVDFEVMIRADEKQGSEAKLNVVAAIVGGNVKGESGKAEGHSATLGFEFPLISVESVQMKPWPNQCAEPTAACAGFSLESSTGARSHDPKRCC